MRRRVPVGHSDFGEVFPCRCQDTEVQSQRLQRLERYSNLGPLRRISFESTDPEGRLPDPESRRQFQAALEVARDFAEAPTGWLVLTGASGSGKSHLAAAVANRCIKRGQAVFFVFVPDLLDHLRGTFAPESSVSYDELFQQVRDAPVLVLDDLGSHSSTPWAREKLFQVVNHRFNAALPTVITVRGSLDHLEEALATRLQAPGFSQSCALGTWVGAALQQFGGLEEYQYLLDQMTFDSFDISGNNATRKQRETLEAALRAARSYARDPHGWLLLTGPYGCGKTHLSVAIANERMKLGQQPVFAFVPALLDHLRAAFSPESRVAYDERFEQVKRASLLILDDLGSESSTPWAEEKLYQIVTHRHNARLPTIITAIKGAKLKPAIVSRLGDVRVVEEIEIDAPDYRTQQLRQPVRESRSRGSPPSALR